ncbi:MAG TPA: META domain-containing protein [Acidobacteriaceae bacterium]|nr:META domain-containing protein [Acidobacteriaceae bacterium]
MRTKIPGLAVQAGLALALAGVVHAQELKQAAPLERTQWKLTWVEGSSVEHTSPRTAFIMLNPVTHRMSGSGGCNNLLGPYELDGVHLRFKGAARTMMACAGGSDTEDKLVDALEKVRQWKISDGELELQDDSGHDLARFTAAAAQ